MATSPHFFSTAASPTHLAAGPHLKIICLPLLILKDTALVCLFVSSPSFTCCTRLLLLLFVTELALEIHVESKSTRRQITVRAICSTRLMFRNTISATLAYIYELVFRPHLTSPQNYLSALLILKDAALVRLFISPPSFTCRNWLLLLLIGCELALEIQVQSLDMSNLRVCAAKSRSEPYLPLDLCSDILSRLPVKSLLRLRCVSKSWRSLIDDPQFCFLHSTAFKNNSHETHLLILQTNERSFSLSSLIVCRQTLEKTKWIPTLAGMDTDIDERWRYEFTVDGLVLLVNRNHEAMLWNPSIRRCRRIPRFGGLNSYCDVGLGFDPVTKDYKYVKRFFRNSRQRVAIYSVRTNSWKTWRATGDCCWCFEHPISFKGSLYVTQKERVLDSFCLSTKAFTRTNLPMSNKHIYHLEVAIVDGGSSLAVIAQPWDGPGYCIIWALELENNLVSIRWSKCYTFTFTMDFVALLFHPKSRGDVLFKRCRYFDRRYFGTRRRNEVVLVSYNMETQKERILQRKSSEFTSFVTAFKESLVLLN